MTRKFIQVVRDEHAALSAILCSLNMLMQQVGHKPPERVFNVMRAMLFYIDEFPEKIHHPLESDLLFPKLLRACPQLMPTVQKLELAHIEGESKVRDLQHLLLAWELLGPARRQAFAEALSKYIAFYLDHMRVEEEQILPMAAAHLGEHDSAALDAAFGANVNPLAATGRDPAFDLLFSRIVTQTPAPVGVGDALPA